MMKKGLQFFLPYFALIMTVCLWGFSFVATKAVLRFFTPFSVMFLRYGSASMIFILVFLLTRFPKFTKRDRKRVFLLALMNPILYFIFETFGIKLTTAGEASIIIALVPIVVVVLSRPILGEDITRRQVFGVVLSITGVAVLVFAVPGGGLRWSPSIGGYLLVLGAVFSAALYTIASRDLGKRTPPIVITGMQTIYGGLFFLPFFLVEADATAWRTLPLSAYGGIIFLILGATLAGFFFYNYSLSKLPAARASLFLNAIPVVSIIGAFFVLGETLAPLQWAGAAIVIAGVYLGSFSGKRKYKWK
jgi:drug/metabolite transporter (DMT)-like permease